MGVLIDLHTHSTESDGTDTPTELVAAAATAGLDVIALTDHDTTAGWAEAERAVHAQVGPRRVAVVPGAELSCASDDGRGNTITVHLLAYLFDPTSPRLVHEQARLRSERRARLHTMACRMASDGFDIDPEDVLAALPPDAPGGRPHLARALIRAGTVSSVDEAFARFLAGDGRYYLPRTDTPVHEAIELIGRAGGVTVLAHPFAGKRGPIVNSTVIADLAAYGLNGVEVAHPDHDSAARERVRVLADELDLIPTGSSDYHGTNKSIALGQEQTSPRSLERLIEHASGCAVFR